MPPSLMAGHGSLMVNKPAMSAANEEATKKQLAGRVVKLRRMYWFGLGFIATHVCPAMYVGGYAMAKSNEFDGVMCMEIDAEGGFVPVYEPNAVVVNLYLVGFFWTGGAFFMFFFVYTFLVWFERLQQVNNAPKLKMKVVKSFREFGTHGVFCACCIFSSGVACYVMFVLTMLVLSGSIGGASDFCSMDEGAGGQMYSSAVFVNAMAWLFTFVTGGEIGLYFFYTASKKKKKLAPVVQPEAPASDAGSEPADPDSSMLETQSVNDDDDAQMAAMEASRSSGGRARAAP